MHTNTLKKSDSLQQTSINTMINKIIEICPAEEDTDTHFGNGHVARNMNKHGYRHIYRLVFPNGYAVQAAPKHARTAHDSVFPREMVLQFKLPGSEKYFLLEQLSKVNFRTFEFLFIVMKGQVDDYCRNLRNTQRQILNSDNVVLLEKRRKSPHS